MTSETSGDLQRLAAETCQHLARERELMGRICQQAQRVRQHLLARDNSALQVEAKALQPLQENVQRLAAYRTHLMHAIAIRLKVPIEQATISQLAQRLDSKQRHALLTERDKLARVARQAQRLHESNLTIASCFTQFSHWLLEALTGQPSVTRYGRSGRLATNTTPSLFQTEV